jgi:hypothetical protein
MMENRNYWGYRIDKNRIKYINDELLMQGRLRQGWGFYDEQDLRKFGTGEWIDEGAKRNMYMFKSVKKGDILLVPYVPTWGSVAIVEATKDWDSGYEFKIDKEIGDLGHIFPAKYIKHFSRTNQYVTGTIRATLKNPLRFWNIYYCGKDIDKLLETESTKLETKQSHEVRFDNSIGDVFWEVFKEKVFSKKLYDKLTEQFSDAEWEAALVHGLERIFPFYNIEKVSGQLEKEHGTDILIKIPGIISNLEYCIAIQVKDYHDFVAEKVIEQINKADYWNSNTMHVIEKIVIVTKAEKDINKHLLDNKSNVRFIFASELEDLLAKMGKAFVGIRAFEDDSNVIG